MQLLFIVNELFYVYEDKKVIVIYFNGKLIYRININEKSDYKNHVIFLCNIGLKINQVANLLHLNWRTVKKWYTIYMEKGEAGLDEIKEGAPGYGKEIEAYIIAKFKDLQFTKNYKKAICEGVKKHFNKSIHWRTVTEILKRNGVDLSQYKYNKKSKIKSKEGEDQQYSEDYDEELVPNKTRELGEEKKQQYSESAGLCFLYPYLQKLNIKNIFSKASKKLNTTYYSALDYIYGIFLLLASNMIEVEEQIKMIEDKNYTLVVGEKGLPSLRNYRKYMPQIIEEVDIEKLQMELAQQYFIEQKDRNEIYIDGHFLPYNGKHNVFKGYNPIRRFVQKGRTAYFLNNGSGRPFFYILSDLF